MNTLPAAPAATIARACKQCRAPLPSAVRRHARYCGPACRVRAHRGSPANTPESVSNSESLNPPAGAVKRFLSHPRDSQRHLRGLLSHLADEAPAWIASSQTGRRYPRTYAEHGLSLPSYMRVEERQLC
jgi:hypothetical protein